MITDKINNLFLYIEFLHSNIENFKQYDEVINDLHLLDKERNKVRPRKNFADKLKYDEVQVDIKNKFSVIQKNIITPIRNKATELNVCNFEKEPLYNWYGVETDIHQIKESFSKYDLPEIFKHKNLYLEYRTKTNCTYFQDFFFNELDEVLKGLFDYFKETEQNEFESFETKTIHVDSIAESVKYLQKGKKKKDTRYWLTTFFEEQEKTKHEYKSFQKQIENSGGFIIKANTDTVKIYTPELAVIFTSKELPAHNMDTQTETAINGWEYLKTYIEAYKEGEQYFETEFKVSPNTLYGENAEQYVRDIHLNFFHVQHTGVNKGWGYVKKQYPIIITHKAVREFGYYSGIVAKVEEQVKKYPRLFATFDKCEHNLPPQQAENIDWINLFDSIDIERPVKPQAYITNTFEQKKNYFSEASFNLTIQYLTDLKKETYLLNKKRKLDYINSLNIEKPKATKTESPLFNQTVFEAKNNYFEFLQQYKSVLESTLTHTMLWSESNMNEFDISQLKENAIGETEKYFKEKCKINSNKKNLADLLNKENDHIEVMINRVNSIIKQDRVQDIKPDLVKYFEINEASLNDILTNKNGLVSNSGGAENLISDYCLYSFYKEFHSELIRKLSITPQQTETKTEQETIEMKPVLKPDAVQIVFEIIKDFFSTEQQTDLKQVIETGNIASKKLLFKGNGNRLTDTFKKLIEHDFITGCQKQVLIKWIISNFNFTQQNKVKAFVYDTVEKTISRNYYPCKSPLIEIKNGQIQKVEQPRTKKYSKY